MRAKEFLLEYRREITAQNWGQKLLDAMRKDSTFSAPTDVDKDVPIDPRIGQASKEGSQNAFINYFLTQLENVDPTPNKQYVQWLAKIYSLGQTKFEDILSRAKDNLTWFETLKNRNILQGRERDINSYKSLNELYSVLFSYPQPEEKSVDKGQAEQYYNDAQIRVIVPLDEQAAKYYGQGTQWCTAARNNNMFNTYNEKGKLYIIFPKQPGYAGEKYQFSFEAGQFMNERDEPTDVDKLSIRWPQLLTIFKKQAIDNLCVPLMPNKIEIMNNWDKIVSYVAKNLYNMLPMKRIMLTIKNELRNEGNMSTIEDIVKKLRYDIEGDRDMFLDMFIQGITPERLADNDRLEGDIEEGLHDWLSTTDTGSTMEDYYQDRKLDSVSATYTIVGELIDAILPILKEEIRNQITKYITQ